MKETNVFDNLVTVYFSWWSDQYESQLINLAATSFCSIVQVNGKQSIIQVNIFTL